MTDFENVFEELNKLYESAEESQDADLEEGIFDSKATKQKKYNELIANAFDKKAPSAIAVEVASMVRDALSDAADIIDDDNVESSKAGAVSFIRSVKAVKANINKKKYGLIDSVIKYCVRYGSESNALDELVLFKRKVQKLQSSAKGADKAAAYLMEIVNKQVLTQVDHTIKFMTNEYGITNI
jgi:hypothetical protein